MTPEERAALNAEYAVVCKGWFLTDFTKTWMRKGLERSRVDLPDYLSDDADAWRRVKALHAHFTERRAVMCFGMGDPGEGMMLNCIALKIQVPNA